MSAANSPRVGMMATVRNRRGVIVSVEPFDTKTDGRLHMVRVEYADGEGSPDDMLLWERESRASLLEPAALPRVAEEPPMTPADFDALTRATRWTAMTPFVATDGSRKAAELPIASPFFGAVQVDDFQLLPLLRALREPRVSLLLADDVGLGKTIEAGLVLQELLLRRRIRRVLVLTPRATTTCGNPTFSSSSRARRSRREAARTYRGISSSSTKPITSCLPPTARTAIWRRCCGGSRPGLSTDCF